jgi:MoaA/NifB/PqqE/SkfB family radical SAM enzyme
MATLAVSLRRLKKLAEKGYNAVKTGYHHGLPEGIFIDVSSYCNLSCKMCPYLKVHEHPTNMTTDTFKRLLPLIKHIPNVTFVGAGEPTINRNLIPFIKLALKANPEIKISLTTNGTLLTESLCSEFIDLKLNNVTFSIDGANAETVEAIRLGVNFSKVIDNVNMLNRLKKEKKSCFPIIRANHMVGYGNYSYLIDFVRLAGEIGINEIHFLEIQAATYDDYKDNFLNGLIKDGGKVLKEAIKLSKQMGIKLILPIMHEDVCHQPYVPHISEEGEVFPCCYYAHDRQLYSEDAEVRIPTLSFGNINKKGFRPIWNSAGYRGLRKSCDTGNFNKSCDSCYKARIGTSSKLKEILREINANLQEYG